MVNPSEVKGDEKRQSTLQVGKVQLVETVTLCDKLKSIEVAIQLFTFDVS